MTAEAQQIAGSDAAQQALRDWQSVRDTADIQYAPLPAQTTMPPQPPAWLKALGEFLRSLFEPIGKAIGMSWPVLQWILIALAVVAVLAIVWRLLEPLIAAGRVPRAEVAPAWTPSHEEAVALLEDADRLAGEGRYDEATHLLLRRSVQQIAHVRPDWLHPASTAREIAGLLSLPSAARFAFGVIADRVERSRYALRALDHADWEAARAAYAEFALQSIAPRAVAA